MSRAFLPGLALLLILGGCSPVDPVSPQPSRQTESERSAERFMVSAAHPLAVEAGLEVLRRGGHAVDAAVAVSMVLGFIEAPETGIGGGGFLLLHEPANATTRFYDGRETAPLAATPERFQRLGIPLPLALAIPSPQAVGVPGMAALLGEAHARHGRLPWAELLQPAIELAETGVPMPPRLRQQINDDWSLRLFADTRHHFHAQAQSDPPHLRNPELAVTLRQLAKHGPHAFYQGAIAEQIVERLELRAWGRTDLTLQDLASYQVVERAPLCGRYRQWTLCGAPPPSSGGLTVLQALGILEHFPLPDMPADAAETLHLIAEASRLAFADRNHYVGDPAFVSVPVQALLDADYLRQRADLIDPQRALAEVKPGAPGVQPWLEQAQARTEPGGSGTSHISIVDGEGNLLALTSSIEAPFGARMLSQGFVLNNQLTDFSFSPEQDGQPHPNAVGPGKRPRSSMAPFIVFDASGTPRLVIGSRGGSRIIGHVLKTLIGVLDWDMDIQQAIALPAMVERGRGIELEAGTVLEQLQHPLEELGHRVRVETMTSGLHGIEWLDGRWRGGADPRLDGLASGD